VPQFASRQSSELRRSSLTAWQFCLPERFEATQNLPFAD
jgi:hypothetical protein